MNLPSEDELVALLTVEHATAGRRIRRGYTEAGARLIARRCRERAVSVSGPPVGRESDTFAESLVREYDAQQQLPPQAVGSVLGFIAAIFLKAFFAWAVQRLFDHLYHQDELS